MFSSLFWKLRLKWLLTFNMCPDSRNAGLDPTADKSGRQDQFSDLLKACGFLADSGSWSKSKSGSGSGGSQAKS